MYMKNSILVFLCLTLGTTIAQTPEVLVNKETINQGSLYPNEPSICISKKNKNVQVA
jgi:hypothetical protein